MGLAQLIVIDIMGRGNLQTSRTELDVHITVLDDWYDASHQGNRHLMSTKPLVLDILGIDTHGGVAHDGLGTRGGYYCIVSAIGILMQYLSLLSCGAYGIGVLVGHVIAQMIEVALLVPVHYLFGAEYRLSFGIPVDHAESTVYQSFVIQVAEHTQHALAALFIHGKRGAVPVATGSQTAKLLEDDAAMLVGPVPCVLEKLLTGEVALLDALLGKAVHHLGLSGYAGMVGTGHPAGILAFEACLAYQDVLYGVVEHVAHVQYTGHIGWWDDHSIGFAAIGLAAEEFMAKPIFVPFALYLRGSVLRC